MHDDAKKERKDYETLGQDGELSECSTCEPEIEPRSSEVRFLINSVLL